MFKMYLIYGLGNLNIIYNIKKNIFFLDWHWVWNAFFLWGKRFPGGLEARCKHWFC